LNTTEVIQLAHALGVRLHVDDDNRLRARPKNRVTSDLRRGIQENKTELLYAVHLSEAMRHMANHYVEGADLSVLDPLEDRVDETYLVDFEAFRAAVRELVRAGLAEFARVREAAA
jgi:hypothetical protein